MYQLGEMVNEIMEYEGGDMSNERMIAFFQKLIDSGMAWTLQGHYGRTADALIKGGYCHQKETTSGTEST